jgi:hypothetical protein
MKKQNQTAKSQRTQPDEFKWDKWQKEVIDYKGSITLRAGRQVGKSTTVGRRASNQMLEYVGSHRLMIAPAQRQSSELFMKTHGWLEIRHQEEIEKAGGFKPDPKVSSRRNMELQRQFEYDHGIYNELPTKTTIVLKKDFAKPQGLTNRGSVCYSLPAGKTGIYLRTYALDFLDIDETAYVPEPVYTALKPMLAVSEKKYGLGWETFLSTPFGKGGFFYNSHHSDDYRQFHISSEDCPRISKAFLKKERQRLTKAEYMQEWQGEFTDEWNQFFPTDLIKRCMTLIDWSFDQEYRTDLPYYLGIDLAGYGGDENAFVSAELNKIKVKIVQAKTTDRMPAPDTIGRTKKMDEYFKYRKIFTDDGGLGSSITDMMKATMGRKVMGLNNSSKRVIEQGEEKKRGIFKEDLYSNALMLMETGNLEIISDLKLLKSLKSITYEYSADKTIKIYGPYSHLAEAMVRACWCVKERGLNLYIM